MDTLRFFCPNTWVQYAERCTEVCAWCLFGKLGFVYELTINEDIRFADDLK